jgi:O-antigen ligase
VSSGLFILACFSLAFNLIRIYGVSIPDALFLAAFISVVFNEGILKMKPVKFWFPSHPLILPAFLILVGGLISSINAVSISSSISITIKEFYLFAIFIPLVIFMARNGNPEWIVSALIASGLITSLAALYDYSVGYKFSNEMLMSLGSVPLKDSWERYSGMLGHPNEQAMFLSVVFPLAFSRFLLSFNNHFFDTLLQFITITILGVALFLTGSVSGYISVAISSLICFLWFIVIVTKTDQFFRNLTSRVLLGLFVIIVFILATFNSNIGNRFIRSEFIQQSPFSGFISRSFDRVVTTTAISRWDDYRLGFNYISSNPIIGAGMDQSGTGTFDNNQMVTYLAIHNTILQSWVAGGLLTFLGTILVYFHVMNYSLRALYLAMKTKTFSILVGLSASSIGFAFMDMTSSNIYQRVKWIIFAALLGLITRYLPLKNIANPELEKTNHDLFY